MKMLLAFLSFASRSIPARREGERMLRALATGTAYVLTALYVLAFLLVVASGVGFLGIVGYHLIF